MQSVDTIHRYTLTWSTQWTECRIRIYEHNGGQVVICSDASQNESMSITSYAQDLATAIVQRYHLDPLKLVWIEHHPHTETVRETFDLVTFTWRNGQAGAPHWQRLSLEEVERLIGVRDCPESVTP